MASVFSTQGRRSTKANTDYVKERKVVQGVSFSFYGDVPGVAQKRLRNNTSVFTKAQAGLKESKEHVQMDYLVCHILFELVFKKPGCTILTTASGKQLH